MFLPSISCFSLSDIGKALTRSRFKRKLSRPYGVSEPRTIFLASKWYNALLSRDNDTNGGAEISKLQRFSVVRALPTWESH